MAKKKKCKTFRIDKSTGQDEYQRLVNSPNVEILKEKEKWLGEGECQLLVFYTIEASTSPQPIEGSRKNGIPTEINKEGTKLPELSSD